MPANTIESLNIEAGKCTTDKQTDEQSTADVTIHAVNENPCFEVYRVNPEGIFVLTTPLSVRVRVRVIQVFFIFLKPP